MAVSAVPIPVGAVSFVPVSVVAVATTKPPHFCDEAVAAPRHRDDEAVLVAPLAEGLAQHRDVLRQVVLLDRRVGPDRAHQLVLLDHAPAVLDQDEQRVEDLRRERDGLVPAPEETFARVNAEGVELEKGVRLFGHKAPSESFRNIQRGAKYAAGGLAG
jgi:hypothetical protein